MIDGTNQGFRLCPQPGLFPNRFSDIYGTRQLRQKQHVCQTERTTSKPYVGPVNHAMEQTGRWEELDVAVASLLAVAHVKALQALPVVSLGYRNF